MTENEVPDQPLPVPPSNVYAVQMDVMVGLQPHDSGATNVGVGVQVSGLLSTTFVVTPDAADRLAEELRQAARLAREQSPTIATPMKKIIIPGR